jgi:hypothetical protein
LCNRPIDPRKRADAQYCSASCRRLAYRETVDTKAMLDFLLTVVIRLGHDRETDDWKSPEFFRALITYVTHNDPTWTWNPDDPARDALVEDLLASPKVNRETRKWLSFLLTADGSRPLSGREESRQAA